MKKLAAVLVAVIALGAIVADGAYAQFNWKATTGSWYTGAAPGTKVAVGTGTIDLTVSGGTTTLTSTIAGSAIEFKSTSVNGNKCSATNPTSSSATIDCERLVFSGVTVSGPGATGCSTPTEIRTKAITGKLGMNTAGTLATLEVQPQTGPMTTFATIELVGECANAGLYKLTGVVYMQAKNATGVFNTTQSLSFSEAIQKDAGTATSLMFSANGAFLNGLVLAQNNLAGGEWAFKEK